MSKRNINFFYPGYIGAPINCKEEKHKIIKYFQCIPKFFTIHTTNRLFIRPKECIAPLLPKINAPVHEGI